MRGLVWSAVLVALSSCGYYAYEPFSGRTTGCGGVHFTCTDDTATDTRSGLMWLRERRTAGAFDEASLQCDSLSTDGKFDWRLPTVEEMKALEDPYFADETYRLDPDVFRINGSLPFFSSDVIDDQQVKGWSFFDIDNSGFNPSTGEDCSVLPTSHGEVKLKRGCEAMYRCVRGGTGLADGGT